MRDKLIELMKEVLSVDAWHNGEFIEYKVNYDEVADYLIAYSATFAKDNNVRDKRNMSELLKAAICASNYNGVNCNVLENGECQSCDNHCPYWQDDYQTSDDSLYVLLKDVAKEFEQLERKQQWIPVSERLPEIDGEEVLICDKDFHFVDIGTYHKKNKVLCDRFAVNGYSHPIDDYSHWMPMPELPKEGEV